MATPNTPAKSVNAWTLIGEDDPTGTGYTSRNSSYQSMVNNKVYQTTDMLFACFFVVVPDGKGYFTIEIGNKTTVHPDGSTTEQYLQYTIQDARAQNPGIKILATLSYNDGTLSQIFSSDPNLWPAETAAFATNVTNYLVANKMNGFDIDWEGAFAGEITTQQFAMLFKAIRNSFNTASNYLYLTLSPASTENLDAATMNTCFDMVNLQIYGGADPVDYCSLGISPLLMAYGAKFEPDPWQPEGNWPTKGTQPGHQSANQALQDVQQGFTYNNVNYAYNNITQWRLNSGNYQYEQGQQALLYQFVYGIDSSAFNDGQIIAAAGNTPITSLIINSGDVLDALLSNNAFGGSANGLGLLQHGGNGGALTVVNLNPGDVITQVSGYTGTWYGWNVVAQLTIKTQGGQVYGPFGNMNNVTGQTAFNFTAPAGQSIVAFNGNTIQVPEADGSTTMVVSSLSVSFGYSSISISSTQSANPALK